MHRTRVRWGRVVALVLTLAAAGDVAAHAGLGGPPARADVSVTRASLRVHVVEPGETLWSIARLVVGQRGDPRPEVDRLIAANRLRDARIFPGQRLRVPEPG